MESSHREAVRLRFMEECRQHASLRHPHVVQLVGLVTRPGDLLPMLVMECMHDTLNACLDKHPHMPMHFKRQILLDVSLGLRFLHDRRNPIIHRDLTANNVLVSEDLRAKISDLGMARIVPTDVLKKLTMAPGTIDYMPPEALVAEPVYGTALDMFSFGVLILHVVTQTWPTPHKPTSSLDLYGKLQAHSEAERRDTYLRKMDVSNVLTFVAERCLSNDPKVRLTAQQVVEKLQTVVPAPTSSFPLLETVWKKEEAEVRRDKLETHCKDLERQLHTIIQDLQGKFTLNEPDLDTLVRQLHGVVQSTRSLLYPTPYDATQKRFIVAYKPPSSMSDSSLLNVSSASNTPNPLSVVVRAPANITFSGTYVKTVISGLKKCIGLAVNGDELYVVDNAGWHGVQVCNISGEREPRGIVSSSHKGDMYGMPMDKCWYPSGVAVDNEKNIIFTDTFSHRVVKFSPDGTFLGSTGKLMERGDGLGEFNEPIGVAVASNGDIYVCDRSNHRVQILNQNLLSVRSFGKEGKGRCEFHHPWDVAFDSKGNVYVVDCSNYCVKVFTSGFGKFLRQIGKEGKGCEDFQAPTSICIDANDYVYVTDKRFCCVKVFDPSGEFVIKFGHSSHEKPEFCFNKPMGIALDSSGRVFVSDSYNGRVLMFM